jgi:hypothetical protein
MKILFCEETLMRKVWLCILVYSVFSVVMIGCGSSPAQKPAQTIAPASSESAALKDVQAQVVSLAQQNTAIVNAIQKSAQDANQFRTEVKGGIASLTQNQFRIGQWVAEASRLYRLRLLGPGPVENLDSVLGDGSVVRGVDVPRADRGSGVRSAIPGSDAQAPVKWRPSMLQLIVAFLLGALLSSVVLGILAAFHRVIADHFLARVDVIVTWLWSKFVGLIALFKPKPVAPPAKS